jgi:hypothetical protein
MFTSSSIRSAAGRVAFDLTVAAVAGSIVYIGIGLYAARRLDRWHRQRQG